MNFVLKGRKKYPWAERIGIPKGSVDRMFQGYVPGSLTLGQIMHTENVSITWLATGTGAPYLVRWFPTDEECRQYFDEMLAFEKWTVHRLTDGGRIDVLVLHAPEQREYKGQWITYTEVHVLAGVGRATLARLAQLPEYRETLADNETVTAVATGEKAGTWDLLGDDGLLTNYKTIEPAGLKVAEQSDAGYGEEETDAISQEERQWVELIRRLDPENRVRLKEVGHAFVAAERDREAGNDGDD